MQVGLVGIGRMGRRISGLLVNGGHAVVGWSRSEESRKKLKELGGEVASDTNDLIKRLNSPRVVWLQVPSYNQDHPFAPSVTDNLIIELSAWLEPGDIIIDGGDSQWSRTRAHAYDLAQRGIKLVDLGISGGLQGVEKGYAVMGGGEESAWKYVEPLVKSISHPEGSKYFGQAGAGHYVKMIHNSIEYGMMQAFAEGINLLKEGHYSGLEIGEVVRVWNAGSIVQSFLSELLVEAFSEDPQLSRAKTGVNQSGMGIWAAETALANNIPFAANSSAIFERMISKERNEYADRVLAVLRKKFGGHAVRSA